MAGPTLSERLSAAFVAFAIEADDAAEAFVDLERMKRLKFSPEKSKVEKDN